VKQLLLLRHAQAEEAHAGLADLDRTLTLRGRAEALEAAQCIAAARLRCQAILVSPAVRATQTATLVAAGLDLAIGLTVEPALYPGNPEALLARLHGCPSTLHSLLLVAHNPGLSEFAQRFNSALAAASPALELRTAGLCVIHFAPDTPWSALQPQLATGITLLR
jgi:phosphohistidine phosphatase